MLLAEDGGVELVKAGAVPFMRAARTFDGLVAVADTVVVERFTISQRTLTKSRQPQALYVIGVCCSWRRYTVTSW